VKKTLIATALLIISASASAQSKSADNKVYGEIGVHNTELKVDGASESPSLTVGTAILGYQFHRNLSAEVFLATGLSKASYSGGAEVKVDSGLGLMLRPSYQFNDKFEAFARVGYGRYKVGGSGTLSGSDTENSVVYGAGANYYFTDKVYGQLSYTSFFDKDSATVRGFGASLGYRF
jgi:opacity protein-like surface antigen